MPAAPDYWETLDPSQYEQIEEGDLVDFNQPAPVVVFDASYGFIAGWPNQTPWLVRIQPADETAWVYRLKGITTEEAQNHDGETMPSTQNVDINDPSWTIDHIHIAHTEPGDEPLGAYLHQSGGKEYSYPVFASDLPDGVDVNPYLKSHDEADQYDGEYVLARSSGGYVDQLVFNETNLSSGAYHICHKAGDPCYEWFLPTSSNSDESERALVAVDPNGDGSDLDPAEFLGLNESEPESSGSGSGPGRIQQSSSEGSEDHIEIPDVDTIPDFHIEASDNYVTQASINALNRFVDEGAIAVTQRGLASKVVDAENAKTMQVSVPEANYDTWDVDTGVFGTDIDRLNSALQDINKSESVALHGDSEEREIEVVNKSTGTVVDTIEMFPRSQTRDVTTVGPLDWWTSLDVPADQFSRMVRAAGDVTNVLNMGVGREHENGSGDWAFKSSGVADIDQIYGYPDYEFTEYGTPSSVTQSHYKIKHLEALRLAVDRKASTDFSFRFSDSDFPVRADFDIREGPGASVTAYIAPAYPGGDETKDSISGWESDSLVYDTIDFTADADGGRATDMFESMATYADETKISITNTGIETRSVDPDNVGMVNVDVKPRFFDSYAESDGFPGGLIGLPVSRVLGYVDYWRKNDDFVFATNSETRMGVLKHDVFTIHFGLIDPGAIRQSPDFPELDMTAEVEAPISALNDAVAGVAPISDHGALVVSDPYAYYAGHGTDTDDDEVDSVGDLNPDTVHGQAFSFISTVYMQDATDGLTSTGDDIITIRGGEEYPASISEDTYGGHLSTTMMIAPYIGDDSGEMAREIQDVLDDEPIDTAFLTRGASTSFSVSAFDNIPKEGVEERIRQQRLSTYPIESKVSWGKNIGEDELRVSDADDMVVPESTIEDVENDVRNTIALDAISSGENVASVTFTSDTEYSLDYTNVQPDYMYRTSDASGHSFRELISEDNNYAYASGESETPATFQVTIRAAAMDSGSQYAVYLEPKPPNEPPNSDQSVTLKSGFLTIGNAYAYLTDYLESHDVEEMVRELGGKVTLATRELRDELDSVVGDYVDYRLEGKPGMMASNTNFFASIHGTGYYGPDSEFSIKITVYEPENGDNTYRVSNSGEVNFKGPGGTGATSNLGSVDVGHADGRDDIPDVVRSAFEQIRNHEQYLARTDPNYAPDWSARSLPGVMEGEIRDFVDAFLPEPKEDIREQMQSAQPPIPFELTDVPAVGPARSEPLEAYGVEDMVDLTALIASIKPTGIGDIMVDLPSKPRNNLRDTAGDIWTTYIVSHRHTPGKFTKPESPPQESTTEPSTLEGATGNQSSSSSRPSPGELSTSDLAARAVSDFIGAYNEVEAGGSTSSEATAVYGSNLSYLNRIAEGEPYDPKPYLLDPLIEASQEINQHAGPSLGAVAPLDELKELKQRLESEQEEEQEPEMETVEPESMNESGPEEGKGKETEASTYEIESMSVSPDEVHSLTTADYSDIVDAVSTAGLPISLTAVTGIGEKIAGALESAGISNTVDLALTYERLDSEAGDAVRDAIDSVPARYEDNIMDDISDIMTIVDNHEGESEPTFVGDLTRGELEAFAAAIAPGTSVTTGERAGEKAIQLEDADPNSPPDFEGAFNTILIEGNDVQKALQEVASAWQSNVDLSTVNIGEANAARDEVASSLNIQLPEVEQPSTNESSSGGSSESSSSGGGGTNPTPISNSTWAEFRDIISETGEQKGRRERDAGQLIEGQMMGEYPGWFEDTIVGLQFGTQGIEKLRLGAALSDEGSEALAGGEIWNHILAQGDPNQPKKVYQKFESLVSMLNPDEPGHEDFKNRLEAIGNVSIFALEQGIVDPEEIFVPADEVREFAQYSVPEMWVGSSDSAGKIRAYMEDVDASYRVAQEVYECQTGSDFICGLLEEQIADVGVKYSVDWLRKQAYTQLVNDEFGPAKFFAYYYRTKEAGGRREEPAFPVGGEGAQAEQSKQTGGPPEEEQPASTSSNTAQSNQNQSESAGSKLTRNELAEKIDPIIENARQAQSDAQNALNRANSLGLSSGDVYQTVKDRIDVVNTSIKEARNLEPQDALEHAQNDLRDDVSRLASATSNLQQRIEGAEQAKHEQLREEHQQQEQQREQEQQTQQEQAPPQAPPTPSEQPSSTPEQPASTSTHPFQPSGRKEFYIFVTVGTNPTLYISPNQSGEPRQMEGSGIADRIALQVRGMTDVMDEPRGTPIGTAAVNGENIVDITLNSQPSPTGGQAPEENQPTPSQPEPPSMQESASERLGEALRSTTIEELNVDDLNVEDMDIENVNVSGSSKLADEIRKQAEDK